MSQALRFDPWAVIEELRHTPAKVAKAAKAPGARGPQAGQKAACSTVPDSLGVERWNRPRVDPLGPDVSRCAHCLELEEKGVRVSFCCECGYAARPRRRGEGPTP